jgi:hypothetical protein
VYLAGVFDSTTGLRSPGSLGYAAIATPKNEHWPEYMAKTYGGRAEPFTSKAGNPNIGWYVNPQEKLDLFTALEESELIQSLGPYERDGVRGKLQKAAAAFKNLEGGDK